MPVADIIALIAVLARLAEQAIKAGQTDIRIEGLGSEHRNILRMAQERLDT